MIGLLVITFRGQKIGFDASQGVQPHLLCTFQGVELKIDDRIYIVMCYVRIGSSQGRKKCQATPTKQDLGTSQEFCSKFLTSSPLSFYIGVTLGVGQGGGLQLTLGYCRGANQSFHSCFPLCVFSLQVPYSLQIIISKYSNCYNILVPWSTVLRNLSMCHRFQQKPEAKSKLL